MISEYSWAMEKIGLNLWFSRISTDTDQHFKTVLQRNTFYFTPLQHPESDNKVTKFTLFALRVQLILDIIGLV